jgi:hypothetical protein
MLGRALRPGVAAVAEGHTAERTLKMNMVHQVGTVDEEDVRLAFRANQHIGLLALLGFPVDDFDTLRGHRHDLLPFVCVIGIDRSV